MTITNNKPCYANNHMSLEQYGLWNLAAILANSNKSPDVSFSFSARALEQYFVHETPAIDPESGKKKRPRRNGAGKNQFQRIGSELIEAGWFKITRPSYRSPASGTFIACRVHPLTHNEFVTEHGQSKCRCLSLEDENPVPISGQDSTPVPSLGQASTVKGTGQSPCGAIQSPYETHQSPDGDTVSRFVSSSSIHTSNPSNLPNPDGRKVAPSPNTLESETQTWLLDSITAKIGKSVQPTEAEAVKLSEIVQYAGSAALVVSTYKFLDRQRGVQGLNFPVQFFLDEFGGNFRLAERELEDGRHSEDSIRELHEKAFPWDEPSDKFVLTDALKLVKADPRITSPVQKMNEVQHATI